MRRDLIKDPELIRQSFLIQAKDSINTGIPGHVLTFDPATQLAQVQVGIQRVDINGAAFTLPPIASVPVHFPGDGFCVEYQIDPGCEGMIMFSQRCMDGWLQTGGVASNPASRFFALTDAVFIPGFRPIAAPVQAFQNNGIRIRDASGNQFAWLKNDGSIRVANGAGYINIAPDGTVTINGAVITPAGDVKTAAGISLNTHRHNGTQPGTGTSGTPVP